MNVSFRWLSQFFEDGVLDEIGPAGLAERLTDQGLAVDELRPAFGPFSGVVLAKVLDARPHPDADRLTLCTVHAGDGSRQVVCGAPNVEVGALYGYAQVGAVLPGGNNRMGCCVLRQSWGSTHSGQPRGYGRCRTPRKRISAGTCARL